MNLNYLLDNTDTKEALHAIFKCKTKWFCSVKRWLIYNYLIIPVIQDTTKVKLASSYKQSPNFKPTKSMYSGQVLI